MNGFGTPAGAVAALARRGLSCLRADGVLHDDVLDALADAGMEMEFNAADLLSLPPLPVRGRRRRWSGCWRTYVRNRSAAALTLPQNRHRTVPGSSAGDHGVPAWVRSQDGGFVSSLTARPVLHAQGRGVPLPNACGIRRRSLQRGFWTAAA